MKSKTTVTRRDFTRAAAATAGATALAGPSMNLAMGKSADTMNVAVIGCGGRGTGAAQNCLDAADGVKIVALADVFEDRLKKCQAQLVKNKKQDIPASRCFTGLDAYKKIMALDDVNMVILATPPAFRPQQFKAAVAAGKNVFMEKPVAVDPDGIRSIIESAKVADDKKLGVVAGTQRRHQSTYVETMKRVLDGMIGRIVAAQCYWNMGGLWVKKKKPEWSDVEWQIRNWLYFTWLSGDHIVEQHVHNLDVVRWGFGDQMPESVYGMGGRQSRTAPEYGNIYDHFCIEYVFPGGVRTHSMCRQMPGTKGRVAERLVGTKGFTHCNGVIYDHGGKKLWGYEGENPRPYVQEHTDLINSIRSGTPLNEAKRVAESTMCAIMGRIAAYTGRQFKTEWAMKKCSLNLVPEKLDLNGSKPVAPVSQPGKTKLT